MTPAKSIAAAAVLGLLLVSVGALSGCGQKGALYLPEKAAVVVARPAVETPEPAADRAPPNTTDQDKKKITPVPVQ